MKQNSKIEIYVWTNNSTILLDILQKNDQNYERTVETIRKLEQEQQNSVSDTHTRSHQDTRLQLLHRFKIDAQILRISDISVPPAAQPSQVEMSPSCPNTSSQEEKIRLLKKN